MGVRVDVAVQVDLELLTGGLLERPRDLVVANRGVVGLGRESFWSNTARYAALVVTVTSSVNPPGRRMSIDQFAGRPGRLIRGKRACAVSFAFVVDTPADRTPNSPTAAAMTNTHRITAATRRPARPRRSLPRSSIASENVDVTGPPVAARPPLPRRRG